MDHEWIAHIISKLDVDRELKINIAHEFANEFSGANPLFEYGKFIETATEGNDD